MKMKVQSMEFDVVTNVKTFLNEGVRIRFRSKFRQVDLLVQGTKRPNFRDIVKFKVISEEFNIHELDNSITFERDYDGTHITILVMHNDGTITVCFHISRALPKLNHPKVYNPVIK